jgi:amino acid adenylation domain-containing protein/non-ribosomal peptide synthase protein (TIGR01720 family)
MKLFELSSIQKRGWLLQKNGKTLFTQGVIQIDGDLDRDRLNKCIQKLVEANDILRTSYVLKDGHVYPFQKVEDSVTPTIHYVDLNENNDQQAKDAIIDDTLLEFRNRNTLLLQETIDWRLFKFAENCHKLAISLPALSADSYTLVRLSHDFSTLYSGNNSDEEVEVIQYPQFSGWQNSLIQSPEKEAEDFWNKHLIKDHYPHENWLKRSADIQIDHSHIKQLSYPLEEKMIKKLCQLADKLKVNLSSIFLGAQFNLNYLRSLKTEPVGLTFFERNYKELELTYGLVSKTIPVSIDQIDLDQCEFSDLVANIYSFLEDSLLWQDYFCSVENSPNSESRAKGYKYGFEFIDLGAQPVLNQEIKIQIKNIYSVTDQFDLKVSVIKQADHHRIIFTFDSSSYTQDEISEYGQQFLALLKKALETPSSLITELSANPENYSTDKDQFNFAPFRVFDQTVDELFDNQVRLIADRKAVVAGNDSLTYHELNEKANAIAAKLLEFGVTRDSIIAVLIERSVDMIAAIIGIIKAGGAYLPIDPSYPASRIDYMLADSGAKILISGSSLSDTIEFKYRKLAIDDLSLFADQPDSIPARNVPSSLVYTIYTSGSTGNPKGVMVEHKNLISLVYSLHDAIYKDLGAHLNISLVSTFAFDGSVKQIFYSLLFGHTLHIVSDETKTDGQKLIDFFNMNKIAVTDVTPLHLELLLNKDIAPGQLGLLSFISGGQQLTGNTVSSIYRKFTGGFSIVNIYGPTECTVDATAYIINRENWTDRSIVPIGRPLSNTKVLILDRKMKAVPPGVIGELFIMGQGVARGYLNNRTLTNDRFIQAGDSHNRMYKTGDIGKWLGNRDIELIGRNDSQVKIRGYRIELDEIKMVIKQLSTVKDCIVVLRDNTNIVAYIIVTEKVSRRDILSHVKRYLPDFMVPSHFVSIKSIPMNLHGKIDYSALPDYRRNEINEGVKYEGPRNEIETKLVNIWKDLLNKETISIHDNFYEIGGDSIKAVQMSAQLYKIGYKVNIRNLFLNPSISTISSSITLLNDTSDQAVVKGIVKLSPIQKHYFSNGDVDMNHFNQAVAFHSKEEFDEQHVQSIFKEIINHHDGLRAIFKVTDSGIIQEIQETATVSFSSYDYSILSDVDATKEYEDKINEIQSSFDLEAGPLVKVALFKRKSTNTLFVVMHHLVMDGYSWRIIFEDISILRKQIAEGYPLKLPLKTDSYKLWTDKIYESANSEGFLIKSGYWQNIMKRNLSNIPKEDPLGTCLNEHTKSITVELDKSYSSALIENIHQAFNTEMNEVLLSAFGMAILECFDMPQLPVFLVGHGRDEDITGTNISRTVGWFNVIYPFIIDLENRKDPIEIVKKIQSDLHAIPDNGIGYSILKYITAADKKANIPDNCKPNIMFNYLGQFDSDVKELPFSIENIHDSAISKRRKQRFELIFTTIMANGKLTVGIQYNEKQYNAESMEKLLTSFNAKLINLVDICLQALTSFQA